MKIVEVNTYTVRPRWGFVEIVTDEGLTGWGEPVLEGHCATVLACVQEMNHSLIGKDPMRIEDFSAVLYRAGFYRGGGVLMSAIAGIDQALWDIKGKALGVPVYKLLGGKTNDKLRAYASQLQFGWRKDIEAKDGLTLLYDPKDYYRVVKEAVDEGYDAVKIDPVFAPTEPAPMGDVMATQGTQIRGCYREHDLKRSVERIAAAREAGGPDMDIIVEIHSLLDANTSA